MLKMLEAAPPDLVILDVMLPDEDGLSLCRRIRAESDLPVIMLTALGRGPHKLAGFDMGADDYVAKPFESAELLARTRAVLRRAGATPKERRWRPAARAPSASIISTAGGSMPRSAK